MNEDAAETNEILVLVDYVLRVVDRTKARFSQDDLMDSFTENKKLTCYDNESPHDIENNIPFYPFLGTAIIIGLRSMLLSARAVSLNVTGPPQMRFSSCLSIFTKKLYQ